MRILTVVGARPNFVKVAPLLEEMGRYPEVETVLVHTGQHYDYAMSKVFFDDLQIPAADINLGVGSVSAVRQMAEIMLRLEPVLEKSRPDVVVVVGDVTSTLAAALTATKMGVPLAHVEAGLRSFDRSMPEEVNRVLTDGLADILFASEPNGVENLVREGRPKEQIHLVGNVMIDALRRFLPEARHIPISPPVPTGSHFGLGRRYGLVTLHRPATVDDPAALRAIWTALEEIGRHLPLIFPMHPRTQVRMKQGGLLGMRPGAPSGVCIVSPLSYPRFLKLESEASLVITDSGGIQEETTALGVPCLTVRKNTERPITIKEGTNLLVGIDGNRLVEEARKILRGEGKKGGVPTLWDGRAAARIIRVLVDHLPSGRAPNPARARLEAAGIGVPNSLPI